MRKITMLIAGLLAVATLPVKAYAFHIEYVSPHPVPHKYGDGFCLIKVPHVHNYAPEDPRLYRVAHGRHYFIGDPTPFGYEGPRYAYYGAHPISEARAQLGHSVYCYIKGPHYHWYQPPPRAHFTLSGGAYWYVGGFPQAYYDERPRYAVINEAYAPVVYTRPVVDVAVAPAVVRAEISLGGPGWSAKAIVGGPPAPVFVPPPAPPVAPVQVGVDINLGGAPVIVDHQPGPPVHLRHDHGRHEGERKQAHGGRPARFIAAPAPIRGPVFQKSGGPVPTRRPTAMPRSPASVPSPAATRSPAPTPRTTPGPIPTRSPAPAQGRSDKPPRLRR